jgi:AcrR family transcriptional regulator
MRLKPFAKPLDQSKRDEILDAALKVFAEVGFKEATVRQICKKAKANVCLVSYYFEGKESLYKSVFERAYSVKASLFENLLHNANEIQSAEEYRMRLKLHIEQLHSMMNGNFDLFKVIHREVMEGMPRLEKIVQQFISANRESLGAYISIGQKKKFIKKDLDPGMVTSGLMLMLTGFLQHSALERSEMFFHGIPKKEIPEAIDKIVTTIFLDGVMQ